MSRAAVHHVPLGSTGLQVTRLGFGGYRIDDQTPEHRAALEAAIAAGCNLIDTSSNYTDGASETLIGEVLADLQRRDPERRRAMVVVTKVGYVQGRNLALALEREAKGDPFPEMVRYMEGCWHCIHPRFLADQIERSRARLQSGTLDVCLLHNPEYFLSDAHKRGRPDRETARAEFDGRIAEAFRFLEDKVRDGVLRFYGVSSNTLVSPPDDPEATSVTRLLQAAEQVAGTGHHFKVLQLPLNLYESGAALLPNTGPQRRLTALQAASEAGLGVLVNRPLNAFVDRRLIRLADPRTSPPQEDLETLSARLAALERDYLSEIAPHAGSSSGVMAADQLFRLAEEIAGLPEQVEDESHWQQIEQQYIIPRINHVVGDMARNVDEAIREPWRLWWERCLPVLQALLAEVGRMAAERGRARTESIRAGLDPLLPAGRRGESLSRKALWVLTSTPGVGAVLVGMRRPEYVQDALGILSWPSLQDAVSVYKALASDRPAD
jgi:uncharacterized protein